MSLRPAWVTERDVSQTGSQEEPTREERGSSLDRGGKGREERERLHAGPTRKKPHTALRKSKDCMSMTGVAVWLWESRQV